MPKAARAASGRVLGGRSAEYKQGAHTPTGRSRSAERWSAPAAIALQLQMHTNFKKAGKSLFKDYKQYVKHVLTSASELEHVLNGGALSVAPKRDQLLARAIMAEYSSSAAKDINNIGQVAKYCNSRILAHAGPPGRMAEATAALPVLPEREAGWWLDGDQAPFSYPRRPAALDSRLRKEIESCGTGALANFPVHSVVCIERAAGRVRTWRKAQPGRAKRTPPARLVKALIHTRYLPTALSNSGDHFYLPVLGRWMSPTEALRLFGYLPEASRVRAVSRKATGLAAGGIMAALGRSVHIGCAGQALSLAFHHVGHLESIRYASSCSGIDAYAAALEAMIGAKMQYVHAAEWRPSLAKALASTYSERGLTKEAVLKDARAFSHEVGPCEIWSFTPPCEKYSKRNHIRSEEATCMAAKEVHEMLWYPRLWRPKIIVAENVRDNDGISVIGSALLSLPRYNWQKLPTDALHWSDMARDRMMWIGVRDD